MTEKEYFLCWCFIAILIGFGILMSFEEPATLKCVDNYESSQECTYELFDTSWVNEDMDQTTTFKCSSEDFVKTVEDSK